MRGLARLDSGTHRQPRSSLGVQDALHAISCAPGYNIRWLMRAIAAQAAKGAKATFLALSEPALHSLNSVLDELIVLRGVLNSVGSMLRAGLSWRLLALPAIALAG